MPRGNTNIKLFTLQYYLVFLHNRYHPQYSAACRNTVNQLISRKGREMYSFQTRYFTDTELFLSLLVFLLPRDNCQEFFPPLSTSSRSKYNLSVLLFSTEMGVYEKWENIKESITAVILKQPSSERGREDETPCNAAFWSITSVRDSLHYSRQNNLPFPYSSSANTVLQSPIEQLALSFHRKYFHLVQQTNSIFNFLHKELENNVISEQVNLQLQVI